MDEMFADLFPNGRSRPSAPADVMAAVIALQLLHGLSYSETVDAVTFDLLWKPAYGLPVTAAAFHAVSHDVDLFASPASRLGSSKPDLRGGEVRDGEGGRGPDPCIEWEDGVRSGFLSPTMRSPPRTRSAS
jgi:hypothetical protein